MDLITLALSKKNASGVGPKGESAYDIAVKNGFTGTQAEWLDSLKGSTPIKGTDYFTQADRDAMLEEFSDDASETIENINKIKTSAEDAIQSKAASALASIPEDYSSLSESITNILTRLKSGKEEDSELHLGFYLDENGDLCQKEDE